MWLWGDWTARLLALPVLVLQLAYVFAGSPQHSNGWHAATVYMYASSAAFLILRFRSWRRAKGGLQEVPFSSVG